MINKIIRNFIAKRIAGRSDDGIMITLKDPQRVTLGENILADLLMRNGIDPRSITSEAQLKNILQQIENAEAAAIRNTGIRNTESAKVFDLEGNKLDPDKPIMGGKQEGMFDNIFNRMQNEMKGLKTVDDQPPPGSRGGKDDIAAPVQSSEESLKNMIEAENKKNINKIKERQTMLNDAIDDASPGFSGDRKVDAELVAENLAARMGLVYDDLPTKQRLDLYDQAYTGLTKKRTVQRESLEDFVDDAGGVNPDDPRSIDDFIPDPEDKATGGRVGLKVGSGKKFLQKVFGAEKFAEMKTRDPEMYVGLLEIVDMYRKRDKEGLKMYLQKFLPHMDDAEIEDFIRGSDGTEGLVGELIRLGSGRDYAGKIEMMKKANEMRKLDNLEVTEDMKRKPNADGGIMRLGLKEGSGMSRRTFMKIFSGLVALPIIGKVVKPFKIGKTVTKVPIIKTDNVAGKPEWFDQLVNKVIIEGDDVTKRFATGERQSIHQKTLDDGSVVRVTEDVDDGAVRVEYESLDNVYEDTVQMQYKKPLPDEGDPRPTAEFTTAESGPVGRADGPDDYSIEIDEVGGGSIKDLDSDVSILKEYATGQKPTMREFIQNKKRKDKAKRISEGGESEMDAVINRQGEFIEADLVDLNPPDLASGGIARMLGE